MTILLQTQLPHLFRRGKVRDTYDLGDRLLMVATDRISAFDVVLPTGIPDKGAVLTQLSTFWFGLCGDIVRNHYLDLILSPAQLEPYRSLLGLGADLSGLVGRSMLVHKAEPVPIECVVRGYLSGSGWAEYKAEGTLAGVRLPAGLRESDKLPSPQFTPATKEDTGHDINISIEQMAGIVGKDLTDQLGRYSIELYSQARATALKQGIIIADTKFEFGIADGKVMLIDEVLTPDSSRFWAVDSYKPGGAQPSFDKQYVRDWLVASGWNKEPPAPELPADVVAKTAEKYREAFLRITGKPLA